MVSWPSDFFLRRTPACYSNSLRPGRLQDGHDLGRTQVLKSVGADAIQYRSCPITRESDTKSERNADRELGRSMVVLPEPWRPFEAGSPPVTRLYVVEERSHNWNPTARLRRKLASAALLEKPGDLDILDEVGEEKIELRGAFSIASRCFPCFSGTAIGIGSTGSQSYQRKRSLLRRSSSRTLRWCSSRQLASDPRLAPVAEASPPPRRPGSPADCAEPLTDEALLGRPEASFGMIDAEAPGTNGDRRSRPPPSTARRPTRVGGLDDIHGRNVFMAGTFGNAGRYRGRSEVKPFLVDPRDKPENLAGPCAQRAFRGGGTSIPRAGRDRLFAGSRLQSIGGAIMASGCSRLVPPAGGRS